MSTREQTVDRLRSARPRSRFVVASLWAAFGLVAGAWLFGGFGLGDLLAPRRLENLSRFLGEIVPQPARDGNGSVLAWIGEQMQTRGFEALVTTLALSVLAIALAGASALLLSFFAARTIATPEPFAPGGRAPGRARTLAWSFTLRGTRLVMVFLRAIPEYVWAFLILMVLGPGAWPAVLALALHNAGILGRLGAEVLENADRSAPASLRGLGGTRAQIFCGALWPQSLNRFLLFFFYRWETCVREATVLGLLGIVSLGYWIGEARTANRYDEMVFFVGLGVAIVLIGDLVSMFARGAIRRAT